MGTLSCLTASARGADLAAFRTMYIITGALILMTLTLSTQAYSTGPTSTEVECIINATLGLSTDGCGRKAATSRPTPTPPPSQKQTCVPSEEAITQCLNGGRCFKIRIGASTSIGCECPQGYLGDRCQEREIPLDILLPLKMQHLRKAHIAAGVSVAVLIVFVILLSLYVYIRFIKRRNDGGDSREGLSSLFVCCSGRSEPPRECNGVTTTTSLDVPDNDQARSANGEHLTINNEQVKRKSSREDRDLNNDTTTGSSSVRKETDIELQILDKRSQGSSSEQSPSHEPMVT